MPFEMIICADDPLAIAAVKAIQTGDLPSVKRLLEEHPELVNARIGDERPGAELRTMLHVVTDWPGHFPNSAATVAVLVEAGADVNARFTGPHTETPMHWAASSDDVAVLDAPLDAARRNGAGELVEWLRSQGARSAIELT